ncbi:glycosyltransferase [Peribacillus butanolivorans]|uniref:glycosyltransferase n=1 Tax=Peribacillus butanolivorans TaxID=421767 RepID=UPI0035D9CAD4
MPAETVGALSILNEFYAEANLDKNIKWIFVLSKPNLEETDNVSILRFPWIKKSWVHRFYFDNVIAPQLVKKYKIDSVLSFQNIIIPHVKVNQILYVHNALPFIDHKFSFFQNRNLWIYQNIISRKIIKSIKQANNVLVQTEWMKKACVDKTNVNQQKVEVVYPKINVEIKKNFEPNNNAFSTFFYPASEFIYKNHKIIVEACKKLKEENISDFIVLFTLHGNENAHISALYEEVQYHQLPIKFVGNLTRNEVFDLYTKSVLLFPSYIETFGLPLLEGKLHKEIVIASDSPFSHEILDGYENAYFFNPFDVSELIAIMKKILRNEIKYVHVRNIENTSKSLAGVVKGMIKKNNSLSL